ncbi:MAG: hypothetical protein ACI9M1_001842, partial [Porticoccaceae bacterium]
MDKVFVFLEMIRGAVAGKKRNTSYISRYLKREETLDCNRYSALLRWGEGNISLKL